MSPTPIVKGANSDIPTKPQYSTKVGYYSIEVVSFDETAALVIATAIRKALPREHINVYHCVAEDGYLTQKVKIRG